MKKFRKIYIEITNRCNLNCSFCPQTARKPRIMSREDFEKTALKTAGRGQNYYLHVMGEPTSHPQLEKILEICRRENMPVNITTNGTLLDRVGDLLIEKGVRSVSVSLHSFEANKIDGDMAKYLDKIMDFCRKIQGSPIICELRLWNFDSDNIYDKNRLNGEILRYLQNNLELTFDLARAVRENLLAADNSNSRKHNFLLKDRIYLGMAEHFLWPDINGEEKYPTGFCYGLRNQIAILADGSVVPCCLDSEGNMILGNIYTQSLDEIISSPRAAAIYTGFTEGRAEEKLCRTCGYMNMFVQKRKNLKEQAIKNQM